MIHAAQSVLGIPSGTIKMNTFKKEERLCSKRLLDLLFKNGSSFLFYPFRVTYLPLPEPSTYPVQIVINAPKRRFKYAHDRNLIKRRTREAYRLNKQAFLYDHLPAEQLVLLSLQYVGKEIYDYAFFEKKLVITLNKLVKKLKGDESH